GHRVEYRLNVRRRARDHTKDLARRRLLLQGLLCLVEQPHILDRDDSLVGQGLEQGDISVGERTGFGTCYGDRPNRLTVAEHGYGHYAPVAALSRDFPHVPKCRLSLDIRDDYRRTSADGSWMHRLVRGESHREHGTSRVVATLASGGERRQMKLVADDTRERRAVASQEAPRALHDRVEDGLWVRRRYADHPWSLRRGRLLASRLRKLPVKDP